MARTFLRTSSQYLDSPSLNTGIGLGDFSVAAMVNVSLLQDWSTIWSNGSFAPAMYVTASKLTVWWVSARTFNTVLSAGTWYSLGIARRAGTLYGYVDGVQEANTFDLSGQSFSLGVSTLGWSRSGSEYLTGSLADVAVWNVGLTTSEFRSLGKKFSPMCVRPSSLLALWSCGGQLNADDDDRDVWGGYDLTPQNAPGVADHPPVIYPRRRVAFPAAAAGGLLDHPGMAGGIPELSGGMGA